MLKFLFFDSESDKKFNFGVSDWFMINVLKIVFFKKGILVIINVFLVIQV